MTTPQPRSSRELSQQLEPFATQLRAFTQPLGSDTSLPPVQQLVPLASQIVVGVHHTLTCAGDPLGTGRHNLTVLRDLATRLAGLAEQALRDEPQPEPDLEMR
jgi:hypothetical protein